jgi:hypothetical protein
LSYWSCVVVVGEEIKFFLRVGDRVKKVSFSGELSDLVQLFKAKFPDELGNIVVVVMIITPHSAAGKSEGRMAALWIVDDNLKKEVHSI